MALVSFGAVDGVSLYKGLAAFRFLVSQQGSIANAIVANQHFLGDISIWRREPQRPRWNWPIA